MNPAPLPLSVNPKDHPDDSLPDTPRPPITRRQLSWEMALAGLAAAEAAERAGGDPDALAALAQPLGPVPVGRFALARPSTRGLWVMAELQRLVQGHAAAGGRALGVADFALTAWAYCEPNSLAKEMAAGKSLQALLTAAALGEFGDMSLDEFHAVRQVWNELVARAGRIGGAAEADTRAAAGGEEKGVGKSSTT